MASNRTEYFAPEMAGSTRRTLPCGHSLSWSGSPLLRPHSSRPSRRFHRSLREHLPQFRQSHSRSSGRTKAARRRFPRWTIRRLMTPSVGWPSSKPSWSRLRLMQDGRDCRLASWHFHTRKLLQPTCPLGGRAATKTERGHSCPQHARLHHRSETFDVYLHAHALLRTGMSAFRSFWKNFAACEDFWIYVFHRAAFL